MSWVKNREEFKQAVLSTTRAISNNSSLESTSQASSRPPSLSNISLQNPPRSSSQISSWRGEADFQAFWHLHHKENPSVKMPKVARDFFAELELSRVEIIGGETFPGAKSNLSLFLNAEAKKNIDNKIPSINPLASNLWLKKLNGDELHEESKNLVSAFQAAAPKNINEFGKRLIKARKSQENFQSIALELMKNLDLMHEPKTHTDEESLGDEAIPEEQQAQNEDHEKYEQTSEEQIIEAQAEGQEDEDTALLEEAQAPIDSTSIDEEIDLTRNFNEDIDQTAYENYKIFTSQFDEIINAIDLATPEEAQRLRIQLDQNAKPIMRFKKYFRADSSEDNISGQGKK